MNDSIPKREKRQLYDLCLSYSHKDYRFAEMLYEELIELGVSTFLGCGSIPCGVDFKKSVFDSIKIAKCYVPVISENSYSIKQELYLAIERSKTIIPVCFSYAQLPVFIRHISAIKINENTKEEAARIAKELAYFVEKEKEEEERLELLSKYIDSGSTNRATEVLCELVNELYAQMSTLYSPSIYKRHLFQLFPLLEKIESIYDYDYSQESKAIAYKKSEVLEKITTILSNDLLESNDLFYLSSSIRLLYFYREIRWACIDTTTGGDLSDGIICVPSLSEDEYKIKQKPFVLQYEKELVGQSQAKYTDDEWQFILSTPRYIYKTGKTIKITKNKDDKVNDDELLKQVASFMREGNKIFDIIGENQQAEEFLRCLILSYERLQKYCEVVGEQKVCAECIDRINYLNKKLKNTFVDNRSGVKAQEGIKILLGLSIPKTGAFDVFISHKSEDTDIASDMYLYLKRNMKEAFYDKESLPEMSESQYRKSIMRALDGSTHFVLILSDLSYIESYWVSLEMEIFQAEIDEGRKLNSNFIMIVTNEVFEEIMKSNKSVLPIEYRRCEIIRVEEYKTKLLSYICRK